MGKTREEAKFLAKRIAEEKWFLVGGSNIPGAWVLEFSSNNMWKNRLRLVFPNSHLEFERVLGLCPPLPPDYLRAEIVFVDSHKKWWSGTNPEDYLQLGGVWPIWLHDESSRDPSTSSF